MAKPEKPIGEAAQELARQVLETGLTRACARCEVEHGVMNRADPNKSHGSCKRHFIKDLVDWGVSPQEAQAKADSMPETAWCPDLGAAPVAATEDLDGNGHFGGNGGPGPEPEPEPDVPQVPLSKILTPEQMEKVIELWNGSESPDQALMRLRGYLQTIEAELSEKGVLPDYLAYMLYAKFMNII